MFILHFKMPLRVYYEIPSQERKEYFANSCLYNVSFGKRTLLGRNWESRLRAQHHPLIPRWCARQLLPPATLLCAAWGNCVLTQQRCCHEVRVFWSRSHKPPPNASPDPPSGTGGNQQMLQITVIFPLPGNQLLNIYRHATVYKQDLRGTS